MKLDCGVVIYVIDQLISTNNQNIINPNLINTNKNLLLFLKNMNLLDQTILR